MTRSLVALLLTTACTVPPTADAPVSSPTSAAPQVGRLATVTRVVDGDTVDVAGTFTAGKERVRLLTVDSPELNARTRADDADCGAQDARDALAGLLPSGTQVVLRHLPGEPERDVFGRTLANVYVATEGKQPTNVSLWLVEHGFAVVYREYRTVETDEAIRLETQAREQELGMWGTCPGGAR